MVYGELGRFPLYVNSQIRCVKYWFRLLEMDDTRLPKQAYLMLLSLDQNGKRCWVTEIRELLSRTGFYYIWLNQGAQNVIHFLSVLKQRLVDMFIQEWTEVVTEKDRYSIYRLFKEDFGGKIYIHYINIYCFRVALTQIRCGVLPINNNMHRYSSIVNHRTCPFCANVLEDEYHFLYECPMYAGLRSGLLKDMYHIPLERLIASKDDNLCLSAAKFVFRLLGEDKLR